MIHYTVKVNNPVLFALVLVRQRIPFEFNPTQKFGKKKWKNGYGASIFELELIRDCDTSSPKEQIGLANILYDISQMPRGKNFEMTILNQYEY